MSKRLLVILLLISVLVNIGFLIGMLDTSVRRYYHDMHFSKPPEAPATGVSSFKAFEDDNIRALKAQVRTTRTELMQELAKDPLNEARVNQLIQSSISTQNAMEQAMGTKLIEYRKTLSA